MWHGHHLFVLRMRVTQSRAAGKGEGRSPTPVCVFSRNPFISKRSFIVGDRQACLSWVAQLACEFDAHPKIFFIPPYWKKKKDVAFWRPACWAVSSGNWVLANIGGYIRVQQQPCSTGIFVEVGIETVLFFFFVSRFGLVNNLQCGVHSSSRHAFSLDRAL